MRRPMLVDFSNFGYRWFMSKKPVHSIAEECLANVLSFQKSLACDGTIIISDWGKSKFRVELYPEYKANRKTDDPEKLEKLKKHFSNMNYALKVLEAYFPCIKLKGIEADDIIAYLTINKFDNCVILSSDQDLLQLNRLQFSPNRSDFISLEKLGFSSIRQFITAKALAGDNSDNIKGLERVGIKTALKYLIKYNVEHYHDLKKKIPKKSKSKIEQRILQGEEIVNRNEVLVNLHDFNSKIINRENAEQIDASLKGHNDLDWLGK